MKMRFFHSFGCFLGDKSLLCYLAAYFCVINLYSRIATTETLVSDGNAALRSFRSSLRCGIFRAISFVNRREGIETLDTTMFPMKIQFLEKPTTVSTLKLFDATS